MPIIVTSTAVTEGAMLPRQYTCEGTSTSPPLAWSEVPAATQTLVVLCEDPDASHRPFTHWLLYNLPGDTRSLAEGIGQRETLDGGGEQGMNSEGSVGYAGPCPPSGEIHHYNFHIYALDTRLDVGREAQKATVMQAMHGHILDEGTLMTRYGRT